MIIVMRSESLATFTNDVLRTGTETQENHKRCKPVMGGGNVKSEAASITRQSVN